MHNQLAIFLLAAKDLMLPCLNKQLFGIECPGCGLQRSVLLLFEGDFLGAFYMYPAIYPLISLVGVLILNQFFNIKYYQKLVIAFSIASVVFILVNYIIKITH